MTHRENRPPVLLLIGSGHAHLFVLEALARGRLGRVRAVLVSPEPYHVYSGMLTGLIGGLYAEDEVRLDLPAIASGASAEFIAGRVTAIQPSEGRVRLEDGELLAYDVLSLAIGASVTAPRVSGGTMAIPLKPIDDSVRLVPELERLVRERGTPAIVVAGAGAAGVETALNIRARLRLAHCAGGRVTVVGGSARLLPERSASAGRLAAQVLAEQSVATELDVEVGRVDRGRVRLSDGRGLPADLIVWATGAAAPALLGESGLASDRDGFALVDDTLRSVSHPNVFVSGDAAGLRHHPALPKAGVFSVREGPVLWRNLAVSLGAPGKLRPYRPQHRFLALLNTGDGRGILSYGAVAIRGRWVLRLKDRIDRRFMRRFGRLKALGSPSPQDRD